MKLTTSYKQSITLASELGKGGEATVYNVASQPDVVAKLYHARKPIPEPKLIAMVSNPPLQPSSHRAIAWPTELLHQQDGQGPVVGFLMPKIQHSLPIFHCYNPILRRQQQPSFDWQALHRTALNLAIAMQAIHVKGHVIGDVNESNILVNEQALVTLVDTDSFQVADRNGDIYRCTVGKPEFTPPELQGVNFKATNRAVEHDLFGLGVLLFQLLMEGFHPFAGVLKSSHSVGRVDLHCIRQGWFPYVSQRKVKPPPAAPLFDMLPPDIQAAFYDCFVVGHRDPSQRPTAINWQRLLRQAERGLTVCPDDARHVFSNHLLDCPWCLRQRQTNPDKRRWYQRTRPRPRPRPQIRPKPQPLLTPERMASIQKVAHKASVVVRVAKRANALRKQITPRQWETVRLMTAWGGITFGGLLLHSSFFGTLLLAFVLIKGVRATRLGVWLLISLAGFWLSFIAVATSSSWLGAIFMFGLIYGSSSTLPLAVQLLPRLKPE